jgi:uncharacterized protein (DUF2236 family)
VSAVEHASDRSSLFRGISSEGILLAAGGRAVLLQIAHPAVGAGVVGHSDFANNALGRLHGTLAYVYAVATGTEADAASVRRIVNRAHAPVRGPGYSAMDPDLQLWVAATLYDSAIDMYERAFGALDEGDAERVYREYAVLGTALQMPAALWPADRAAFREYWASTLERLEVDESVREVRELLLDGSVLPWWARPAMPLVERITTGLLPPRVRELYGTGWDAHDARRFERSLSRMLRVYRRLPSGIRRMPRAIYLRRLRRMTGAGQRPSAAGR